MSSDNKCTHGKHEICVSCFENLPAPADDPSPVDDIEKELAQKALELRNTMPDFWNIGWFEFAARFAIQVTADKDRQIAELKKRDAELSNIEFALSRRTALDRCKTTMDKVLLMLKLCKELDSNGMKAAALKDK